MSNIRSIRNAIEDCGAANGKSKAEPACFHAKCVIFLFP